MTSYANKQSEKNIKKPVEVISFMKKWDQPYFVECGRISQKKNLPNQNYIVGFTEWLTANSQCM